jgi:SAM-dependent methyltransferase
MALRSRLRRILGWPARRLLDRRVEWVIAAIDERFGHFEVAVGESLLGHRLASLQEADRTLPRDTARFLNWAGGPKGPAARGGLWFNPPVALEYGEDSVEVLLVNERIVELPYAFVALASVRRGARILDVGGAESTVALSLAALGHEVHVVDPRGYRLEHPNLHVHAVPLSQLDPDLRFDAAVALSSIEHFGLGAYGLPREDGRSDHAALREIRKRLALGGVLVLTVPCARNSSADDFQRVYSPCELREMLAEWEVVDPSAAWRRDQRTWVRGSLDDPAGRVGVALITARRAA